jgi:hypothetical protein
MPGINEIRKYFTKSEQEEEKIIKLLQKILIVIDKKKVRNSNWQ